jgi:large-conductance mechanosensitive channel
MTDIQTPQHLQEFPLVLIKNMIALATSGFGLVLALAWNQLIQKIVADYIDPYFGKNGGVISLFLYAVVITLLAVLVITQLAAVQRKLEELTPKREPEC